MKANRLEAVLFSAVLSGLMTFVLSALSVLASQGAEPGFAGHWWKAWASGWAVAFPLVLVAAPLARRLVRLLVGP